MDFNQLKQMVSVRGIGLAVGPLLALGIYFGTRWGFILDPRVPGLGAMAGVAALMAVWWLSEAVPMAVILTNIHVLVE